MFVYSMYCSNEGGQRGWELAELILDEDEEASVEC